MNLTAILILVLAAVCILLLDLVLLLLVAISAAREREGRPPILARKWSLVDFFFGAQVAGAATIVFGMGTFFVAEAVWPSGSTPTMPPEEQIAALATGHPAAFLSALAFQDAAFFVVPLLYFRLKYRLRMRDIGLTTRHLAKWLLIAFGLAAVTFVAVYYLQALNEVALEHYEDLPIIRSAEGFSERTSSDTLVGALAKAWHPAVAILAVAVLAPIAEEFFFRAFTYNVFKARLGIAWGVAISSLLFSAIHLDPARLPTYFVLAAILAYSYERTRNLMVPITIHFVNNLTAIVALYWFSHTP